MGTVGYMSPEQVRGQPVDARSDIFSFGSILYELLTGKRAFKRDTAGDTIAAILLLEPPEMAESGRPIPVALDHIVRHCLEKHRDRRFQSARDIVFALSEASDPLLTTGASHAAFPPPSDPATGPMGIVPGRRKMPGGISGIVIVVAILAVAAGLPIWRRLHPAAASSEETTGTSAARRIAVLPFENLGPADDEYFADGIADEIRGKLTSVAGIEVIARASSMPYRKTTKTPDQIAKELGVHYLLTATVRWEKKGSAGAAGAASAASRVHVTPELVEIRDSVAPTARWRDSFDAALTDVFQVQSDIASRVAGALGIALRGAQQQVQKRPTENLAAYDALLRGRDAESRGGGTDPPTLRKSLGFYEQAVALDPGFSDAWARLSIAAAGLYSNGTPTPELARRSREAAEKAIALAPDSPEGYFALGGYERRVANDLAKSAVAYEKARRLAPGDSRVTWAMALLDQSSGRWEESIEKLRQTTRLEPRSVSLWRTLGFSLLRLRRIAESREALDQALLLAPTNVDVLEYKTMTYLADGDLARARSVLAGAPKEVQSELVAAYAYYYDLVWVLDEPHLDLLLRMTPSAFDDDRGQWAVSLSEAAARKGDAAAAKKYGEEAAASFAKQVAELPADSGRRINLALALAHAGRKEEAIREGLKAVELDPIARDQLWGPYVQQELVRVYILVGEQEKALDSLEPLLKMPYYLTPKWLAIDPNFDPLRGNPRFERLVAGGR